MYVWAVLMASFVEFVQGLANFLLGCLLSSKNSGYRSFIGYIFCKYFFPSLALFCISCISISLFRSFPSHW